MEFRIRLPYNVYLASDKLFFFQIKFNVEFGSSVQQLNLAISIKLSSSSTNDQIMSSIKHIGSDRQFCFIIVLRIEFLMKGTILE